MADTTYRTTRRREPTNSDLSAGLFAGLWMTLVMLVQRERLGIAPPTESIPYQVASRMPVKLFNTLVELVGGYNQLKILGVLSALSGQLLAAALGGRLYARLRKPAPDKPVKDSRADEALILACLVVPAWLLTLALLRPALGANFRGQPTRPVTLRTALSLLLSYASYAAVLPFAYRALIDASPRRPTQRGLTALGAALSFVSGGLLWRLYQQSAFPYDGLTYDQPDPQATVPNDKFYIVTNNLIDPQVERDVWRLEVRGLVDKPQTYRVADLMALPSTTQATTLMCISNEVGGGLMSNAEWTGVPLSTLIDAAQPGSGVIKVRCQGVDGYVDTLEFDKAMDPATLVVYQMNGEPLAQQHGCPVRLLVPGLFGHKSLKWLTKIELVDHDVQGFYEQQGWGSPVVPTHSRITTPTSETSITTGTPVKLRGTAFAGARGIKRVEVSLDHEQIWHTTQLDYHASPLAWAVWSYDWRPSEPGEYPLAVRATDGTGAVQTATQREVGPGGATGYHRVTVNVRD